MVVISVHVTVPKLLYFDMVVKKGAIPLPAQSVKTRNAQNNTQKFPDKNIISL